MGHGMATPPITTSQTPANSGRASVQAGPSSSSAGLSSAATSASAAAENEPLAIPGPSQPSGSQPALWTSGSASSRRGVSARRRSNRCSTCGKTFSSPGKLAQHQFAHTGERPFPCTRCDKGFSSKFKLMRHVLTHSKERQFRCPECNKGFYRKDHLKNHMETHNPHKMMFKCPRAGCGKEYTSSTGLKKHVALHAAEDGNLMCTLCGVTFTSKPDIIFHLKSHAGSRTVKSAQDKKFQCDVCKKRFFTRKDVKRHLVVHTGSRDFVCDLCPQKFGRKDHLVRHVKKSHSSAQGAALRRGRVKSEPAPAPATPGSPADTASGAGVSGAATATASASASAAAPGVFPAGEPYYPDEGGGNGGGGNGAGAFRPPAAQQFQPPLPDMDLSDLAMPQGFEPPEELPDLSVMLRTEAYSATAAEMFYLPRHGELSQPVHPPQPELFGLVQPVRPLPALQGHQLPRHRAPTGGKDLSSLLRTSEASESGQEASEETRSERQRTPSPGDYESAQFPYFGAP